MIIRKTYFAHFHRHRRLFEWLFHKQENKSCLTKKYIDKVYAWYFTNLSWWLETSFDWRYFAVLCLTFFFSLSFPGILFFCMLYLVITTLCRWLFLYRKLHSFFELFFLLLFCQERYKRWEYNVIIHVRRKGEKKERSKKDTKKKKNSEREREGKMNMLDIQGRTNREMVIGESYIDKLYNTRTKGEGKTFWSIFFYIDHRQRLNYFRLEIMIEWFVVDREYLNGN